MTSILNNRYFLQRQLQADSLSESWLGHDEDQSTYLIKLWRYEEEKPDNPARALWNSELRTLYRLCSSPSASEAILTLRYAGIDLVAKAFVMVLQSESGGYENLATPLANRSQYPGLALKDLRDMTKRELVWQGLHQVAEGIKLLHFQHVIHRNISAQTVYFDSSQGADSWRLGGFEWSLRLGITTLSSTTLIPSDRSWVTPPELLHQGEGYTFDTDWYAFGMLIARCFYNVDQWSDRPCDELNRLVYQEVEQNRSSLLSEIERDLILRLISHRPIDRLTFAQDIVSKIETIRKNLAAGTLYDDRDRPLDLVVNSGNEKLIDACINGGFIPNPEEPGATYSKSNLHHVANLKAFLHRDLEGSLLYPTTGLDTYLLVGKRITLLIGKFNDPNADQKTWDAAFVISSGQLKGSDQVTDLKDISINVVALGRGFSLTSTKQSWERYLPKTRQQDSGRSDLNRFQEFLRCTNQLELLMRDTEIFPYEITPSSENDDAGFRKIRIIPTERSGEIPEFCKIEGGLLEFLQREIESAKPDCHKVLLTPDNRLRVYDVSNEDWWEIVKIYQQQGFVELQRSVNTQNTQRNGSTPPPKGYIRTYGHYGQIKLIQRRKNAIDRLLEHSYLLRSLAQPGMVSMDTGIATLAHQLPEDKVDTLKTAVIKDIQRVRPIYTLQGPPGTGKTTLVAYLLREILEEDPMAQILVTAQAHGAVDVLRAKVQKEAFSDVSENIFPLAIRLGRKGEKTPDKTNDDTVEQVSRQLLERTYDSLKNLETRSPIQQDWFNLLNQQLNVIHSNGASSFITDFQQLVKRGASITYCTTSAGDLADLAEGSQSFDWSFDWSILEEAGKAHGFDLALPLQAGHRWLLLGDQKQLPPYRVEDYEKGIDGLDDAVEMLNKLPDRSLVDKDWIKDWQDRDDSAKQDFKKYVKARLRTFGHLFNNLEKIHGEKRVTQTEAIGATAGMLAKQYRMHPVIGDLISEAFYDGQVENGTVNSDGSPKSDVCHPFNNPKIDSKFQIAGKSLVWIDTPWCQHDPSYEESGERQGKPRYTNQGELQAVKKFLVQLQCTSKITKPLKVAVLSPYNQQVRLLNKELPQSLLPEELELVGNPNASVNQRENRWSHTVDSFQGNQSDLIIVSLVRNNTIPSPEGLGFLKEPERLNVLLSRAEKLLIIVGSWDFFQEQLANVDLGDKFNPLWSWKKILKKLEEGFETGLAVKIPVNSIR